jgi:hypothetical protein
MKKNKIKFKDCFFYHVQDLPNHSKPTKGIYDLRGNVNKYLGNVEFKNKKVLELGPASGFLSFFMEKQGAKVSCVDLSTKKDSWDVVPNCRVNFKKYAKDHMRNIQQVQNSFWYSHKILNSKVKVFKTHINKLDKKKLGTFEIGTISLVLLHLENPFRAIWQMCRITEEKIIITEVLDRPGDISLEFKLKNLIKIFYKKIFNFIKINKPVMTFYPTVNNNDLDIWYFLSPKLIINFLSICGFEKYKINYHKQICKGKYIDMYTIVAERSIPINKCFY